MRYNIKPLWAAQVDDELLDEAKRQFLEALPAFFHEQANKIAEKHGVQENLANLVCVAVLKDVLPEYAATQAAQAIHSSATKTAIAHALGYAASSNLDKQLPALAEKLAE